MPREDVAINAEGRVWTGAQALDRGLIDHLGGLSKAIELAQEAAPEARRAEIIPIRPQPPKLTDMILPQALLQAISIAELAERPTSWAILPFELRIR